MAIKVIIRKKEQEVEYRPPMTVKKVFKQLNLLPEAYLVIRNGELIVEQDILRDGETVKLVPVVSGGSA